MFVDDQPVRVVAVDGVVDVLGGGEEGHRVGRVQRVFYQSTPSLFRRQGSRGGGRGCSALSAPTSSAAWAAASAAAAARAAGCQLPHKLLVHLIQMMLMLIWLILMLLMLKISPAGRSKPPLAHQQSLLIDSLPKNIS